VEGGRSPSTTPTPTPTSVTPTAATASPSMTPTPTTTHSPSPSSMYADCHQPNQPQRQASAPLHSDSNSVYPVTHTRPLPHRLPLQHIPVPALLASASLSPPHPRPPPRLRRPHIEIDRLDRLLERERDFILVILVVVLCSTGQGPDLGWKRFCMLSCGPLVLSFLPKCVCVCVCVKKPCGKEC